MRTDLNFRRSGRFLIGSGFMFWMVVCGFAANIPSRPFAGKGPDARTLVVYADQRSSYSLADSLELLKLQLHRVATSLESIPAAEATPEHLAQADYLVVFCPQAKPVLTTNFLQTIAQTKQPLLWVGFGAQQIEAWARFGTNFQISAFAAPNVATHVEYRGRKWNAPVAPWIPATLSSPSEAEAIMTLENQSGQRSRIPLCWRLGNFTFFGGLPSSGPSGYLFEDLLLDFYQVKEISTPRLLLCVEDYHARSNHRELQRKADYLYSRHIPFVIALIAPTRDVGVIEDLDAQPEFVNALRYAQQRGGRLVLKGFNSDPTHSEFWNTEQDAPIAPEHPEKIRERLHQAMRQLLRHQLFPLAWQTPAYAASREAYTQIAQVFSTGVERLQLSDSTRLENGVTAGLSLDRYGRLLVPENMGFALDSDSNSFGGIKATGEAITRLRGSVGAASVFAYQSLGKLLGLVETLETFHTLYLDVADLDNVVQLPESLLLSGHAQRTITLRNAAVSWKAFERGGKLLAEEKEPLKASGPRTLKRRGVGDYELFEFSEAKP